MQGFIPLTPCFIILSNYLHRFAHQASVHWQDVIASAINQETFWGRLESSFSINTNTLRSQAYVHIDKSNHSFWHFIFDVLSLQLNVLVVLTLIIPVWQHVYRSSAAPVFISLKSGFALSPLEKKALCICDWVATEWCITDTATVVCQGQGAHCVLMRPWLW